MRTSTHFKLNLVEGADKVNPLVQDVPNYETIDNAMYDNKVASIGVATELRTGTVHALTRQNEDAPMFRFTASSNYASGDTFTVDGVQVSALLVDGTPLPNMAYIIGSEVLCVLKGTLMTVFANRTTSSDSDRLGGELPSHYASDSDLDALDSIVDAHTNQINKINSDLTGKIITSLSPATNETRGHLLSRAYTIMRNLNLDTPHMANIKLTYGGHIYHMVNNNAGNDYRFMYEELSANGLDTTRLVASSTTSVWNEARIPVAGGDMNIIDKANEPATTNLNIVC